MMENPWDEIRRALDRAREINSAADNSAAAMARIINGRLRHVPPSLLRDMKRELQGFNMKTGAWRKK